MPEEIRMRMPVPPQKRGDWEDLDIMWDRCVAWLLESWSRTLLDDVEVIGMNFKLHSTIRSDAMLITRGVDESGQVVVAFTSGMNCIEALFKFIEAEEAGTIDWRPDKFATYSYTPRVGGTG